MHKAVNHSVWIGSVERSARCVSAMIDAGLTGVGRLPA